jgi:hypothetical protein
VASGELKRPTTDFSAIHQRQLFSVFKHVDRLLTEMLAIAGGTMSGSPFEEYVSDLPAENQAEIRQNIENLRGHILRILEEKGITIHKQLTSATHAVRIRVQLIEIAFESLKPKRMGGYGQLTPQARHELQEIVDELAEVTRHFQEASGNGKDSQNR